MGNFVTGFTGELAALLTSGLWAATSTLFTIGGKQVGSAVVNRTRLLLAILLIILAHLVLGQPLPTDISGDRLFWLSISGVIGLTLGDAFLFQAFVLVGPRISMLMMAMAPVMAAVLAWGFLDEQLTAGQGFGILLTISGIAWVVAESNGRDSVQVGRRIFVIGVLFGLGGAAGQALGLVTAKQGMYGDFPAISATLVRMLAAASVLWLFTLLRQQVKPTFTILSQNRGAMRYILFGSITGPFLGVTFSLIAVQNTEVGVASALMALPPILLLPVGYFVFGERCGWQAVVGTFIAVAGVVVLFLV